MFGLAGSGAGAATQTDAVARTSEIPPTMPSCSQRFFAAPSVSMDSRSVVFFMFFLGPLWSESRPQENCDWAEIMCQAQPFAYGQLPSYAQRGLAFFRCDA